MSYDDRPVSGGPARDDPELGDTFAPQGGGSGPSGGDRAREAASTGRDQAQGVATTTGEQARSVATTAGSEARQVAESAGEQARRLAGDARQELRAQAGAQMERVAEGLDDLTRQLRSMGERGEPGPATDLARQAADRTQQVAERLRDGGVDDAVEQLRNLGRNRPGLFLLGAFGAGLVAGRVARNLAQDPTGNRDGDGGDGGGGVQRQPATVREPGTAGGQGTPFPTALPEADVEASYASGHAAYGAPVGDQRWGR